MFILAICADQMLDLIWIPTIKSTEGNSLGIGVREIKEAALSVKHQVESLSFACFNPHRSFVISRSVEW